MHCIINILKKWCLLEGGRPSRPCLDPPLYTDDVKNVVRCSSLLPATWYPYRLCDVFTAMMVVLWVWFGCFFSVLQLHFYEMISPVFSSQFPALHFSSCFFQSRIIWSCIFQSRIFQSCISLSWNFGHSFCSGVVSVRYRSLMNLVPHFPVPHFQSTRLGIMLSQLRLSVVR